MLNLRFIPDTIKRETVWRPSPCGNFNVAIFDLILLYHEWIMASKKKNLTTIDERTRSQNSRYDPFHHLEQRQGRTVFGRLLGHFCSRHWRVAVRVFNAPEALSLTCRCRGVLTFILSTKIMSFVIYAGPDGVKATRCLCFLREDCWIWCCHSYLGLGLEESAAIIRRVVEYMNLDMTWYGCSDILTPVFSPFV